MKLSEKIKFENFETVITISFWTLLFASPLLFGNFENEIDWDHVKRVWLGFLPLLGVFFLNRFVLLPKLFFKGKRLFYFLAASSLIIGATFVVSSFEKNHPKTAENPRFERTELPQPEFSERRPPRPSSPRMMKNHPKPIPVFANFLILAILLVGFDTGLQISMRWSKLEKEQIKLQKENVENQLAFLKTQVSPHFFMNTLNNIHSLVDVDSDHAKDAIIKLSSLMRHLLYDSEEKTTPIKKEVAFIKSYVELMKLRYSDRVGIKVTIPTEIPEKTIPPLLFTSLLENAFKHGVSYRANSFIYVEMKFSENELYFEIENSNNKKTSEEASGIGLVNTRKRLDLLYKENYVFNVLDTEDIFKVELNLPI